MVTFRRYRLARSQARLLAVVLAVTALVAGLPAAGPRSALTAAAAATCPCTIWPATATPGTPADPDAAAVEVGVKFRSDVDGAVTGVRFYKGSGNTGTHLGHLWSRTGTALATATFTGETATGWQQVLFATPVPVTAGTTYVASYYAPNGRYAADTGGFTTGVDNAPLHALADGADGGNGVYRYGTGGGFPTGTWQAANYWVDVVFTTTAADTTPPTVTGTAPATGATGVPATSTVAATFSEAVQPGTIGFTLRNPAGTAVPASQAYDAATRTATLTPSAPLAASTQYTATVSGVQDTAGNTMAQPYVWSFSTGAPTACPCSIWPASAAPAVASVADASAVELGVKFRSSTAGSVQGIRFYKGTQNTGTHTGSLWSRTGTRLATVTFAGETGSGWQQALFSAPVAISANTTYVASYHTDTGFYAATGSGLASAVSAGPLTALASGTDGGNGVYRYGASAFPSSTFQASNYWVDVVFGNGVDTAPPTVIAQTPAPGATAVPTGTNPAVTFSEDVAPASIAFTLTTAAGAAVPGSVAYSSGARTATFTPAAALSTSTGYTAAVSGVRDLAGNAMAGPVSWSFTTAAPPPPPPTQGPGGPVLVIGNTAAATSQFSLYTAEILRAEGLNEFATADLAAVTASTLAGYDVVILGATPLSAAQVTMFSNWVTGGGRLVAFRPDKQLAGLLGLTSTTGTLAEGYLRVNTAAAPGAGITDQTIQFHGTADRYTLAGATAVGTLYSTATAATTNPAVTVRAVGSSGGQAAAFSYDLPRSIVYTRQGNPAWAGQERDGRAPIRSDDLFYGGSATDWVNLNKVAIPQADELQRLLANLVLTMNRDRKPLPRFWYLPRSAKAVVVGTGDDHGNGGTAGRFDQYQANSPAGCSVSAWTCLRFSSYLYPSTPLSGSQAATYRAAGFELGLHPETGCANFTAASLENTFSGQLSQFAQSWPGLPSPVTNRTHCIVYSDWATHPKTELRHGIRLDTNYYYWPGSWINDRPGFMTGSGLPMRFADTDGTIIDAYQAPTQMTDESDQSYPATPNALLDNALGPLGYYGAFVANMHTDAATTFDSDQLIASATARGVPIISAEQLLSWVDGRNASAFTGLAWSGGTLSFGISAGDGATGLTAMLPTAGPGGTTLSGVSRGGSAVAVTRSTIKGVEYAVFPAAAGSYTATYAAGAAGGTAVTGATAASSPAARALADARTAVPAGTAGPAAADTTAPAVSTAAVFPLPDGTAEISWRTGEAADASVVYGSSPGGLDRTGYGSGRTVSPAVVLTGLTPDTTYHYRILATDAAGNRTVWPAPDRPAASFVTTAAGVADRSLASLRLGRRTGTDLRQDRFGEVSLAAADGRAPGRPARAYRSTGGYVSRVLDAQAMVSWDRAYWQAHLPAGTTLVVSVRTGSTPAPDRSWTGWRTLSGPGARVTGDSRYLQYQLTLRTRVPGASPVLRGIGFTHNGRPPTHPGELRQN